MAPPNEQDLRRVWLFFAVTYLWSWLIWVPALVAYRGFGDGQLTWWLLLAGLLGAWGPSVAAGILTWFNEGMNGLRRLLCDFLVWRIGLRWYAVALLLPGFLLATGIVTQSVWSGSWSQFEPSGWVTRLIAATLFVLPFGPLGEEAGWRGYALPKLQCRFSALASSLIVGIVWTAWHIPLFWVPGAALPPDASIDLRTVAAYLASVLGTSVLFTWIFNNTAGSLLLAVLLHLSLNVTGQVVTPMFPDWSSADRLRVDFFSFVAAKWCFVMILIALLGPARLSRSRRAP
jgi:membrane protease YdiL (CAAX protease family)